MKNYKLAIFDLDGTLANTSEGIFNAVRYVQSEMGLPDITEEQRLFHIGPPIRESYNRNFGLTDEALEKAITLHRKYAVSRGYTEVVIYDGIINILSALREKGIKTAVATLKMHATALNLFEYFDMSGCFDYVHGAVGKVTKTDLVHACINDAGVTPSQTVLIGDSRYDAEGAAAAGVDFIAVTYGFGFKTPSEAEQYANVAVCRSVEELGKALADI